MDPSDSLISLEPDSDPLWRSSSAIHSEALGGKKKSKDEQGQGTKEKEGEGRGVFQDRKSWGENIASAMASRRLCASSGR